VANTYPPTTASCPHVVSTGVRFMRVSTLERGGHQVKIRDSFSSTDHHAHSTSLDYGALLRNQAGAGSATGDIGYAFPGHGSTVREGNLGQTLTGLGTKAGTIVIRSDIHALATEPDADTMTGSWSRPPSKVAFATSEPDQFQMQYSLPVSATRPAFIGFAISERWATAAVTPLAAAGVADFMVKPVITSPHAGATIHSTTITVKGTLTAGANGLPTKVRVNGHAATITVTGAARASYKVSFHASAGKHKINVTAFDAVGNAATTSRSVKNT
jgi:hypothetical protein